MAKEYQTALPHALVNGCYFRPNVRLLSKVQSSPSNALCIYEGAALPCDLLAYQRKYMLSHRTASSVFIIIQQRALLYLEL